MSAVVRGIAGVALIALSFINPLAGTSLAKILFSVGGSLALGAVSQALVGTPDTKLRQTGQEIEYTGTVEPRRLVYGINKVSGMNMMPPWTSGDNNEYLHQSLALAGHTCDGFGDVFFNDEIIPTGDIQGISNTLNSGRINSGIFTHKAWIRRRRGTVSQQVDYILNQAFPSQWTADFTGAELAYVALQYLFDEDTYSTGKPEVSLILRGKICYDPRLDTAPGEHPSDPDYAVFTDNPALCLADYLIDTVLGLGESTDRIDWFLVAAAANICDEDVLIPPASPATTQKRYTCNVVLEVALNDEELRANITTLAQSMLGHAIYTAGVWKIFAGAAQASTFELTEDDLGERFTIRTEVPSNEKYNYVRGQFVDEERNFQLSEFEPRSDAAYEVEDLNKRLPKEVIFPTCIHAYEAQRNAIVILKRSRLRKQLTAEWGMAAFKMRIWDVGTVSFPALDWVDQLVRCTSWAFTANGTVEATLLEEDPDDWDDPLVADYTVPSWDNNPDQGGYIPPPAVSWTATPQVDGIRFHIELGPGHVAGMLAQIYEGEVGDPFDSTTTPVTPKFSAFSSFTLAKSDTDPKDYWLVLSLRGVESTPSGPVTSAALELTTQYHLQINKSSIFTKLVDVSSGNSDGTVTVTPVNGDSPFTYLWEAVSGDSTITALVPTSATTGFHVTGLQPEESNTRIFKCTATDNSAAEAEIQVRVTFTRQAEL